MRDPSGSTGETQVVHEMDPAAYLPYGVDVTPDGSRFVHVVRKRRSDSWVVDEPIG